MKKDVRLRPPPRLPDLMWSAEHPNVAAREALQRGVDALGLSFAGTIKGELEAVHQFRIAVRRLRAVLQLFRPVLQQGWFNRYRAELRLLSRTIGAVRDCDVLWQNIIDASPELDPLLRDALAPVYDGLMERRRREHDEASAWLSAPRYQALTQALPAAAVRPGMPSSSIRALLPELVQPLVRAVQRAGAKLNQRSRPGAFHRLRVKIKPLRYTLEMLESGEGGWPHKAVRRLKAMQETLGAQHDLVIAMAWLQEFAASAALSRQTLLAVGALHQVFHRRGVKMARRASHRWRRLASCAVCQKTQGEIITRVAQPPARKRSGTLTLAPRGGERTRTPVPPPRA
jgi:CHAD domain-containing protein